MHEQAFKNIYENHTGVKKLLGDIQTSNKESKNDKYHLSGLKGSSKSMLSYHIGKSTGNPQMIILQDKEAAAYFFNDLEVLAGGKEAVLFFPSSYKRIQTYDAEGNTDQASLILRTEILDKLKKNTNKQIIITYPEAIIEKVASKSNLETNTLPLKTGENINIEFITEVLTEYNFKRVDFVYEPGQYSIRGSIVDIFSYSGEYPYRIDFFGEEIESIRTFDITSQLSIAKFNEIAILPDIQTKLDASNATTLFRFMPQNTVIWCIDLMFTLERIDELHQKLIDSVDAETDKINKNNSLFVFREEIEADLSNLAVIEMSNTPYFSEIKNSYRFNTESQIKFQKNFDLLKSFLEKNTEENYQNIFLSQDKNQIERLHAIYEKEDENGIKLFDGILCILHEGFTDHDLKISVLTDHQIFDRYHKFRLKDSSQSEAKEIMTLKEIHDLHPGDYVVHVDHGIGKFGGLQKIEIEGKFQEAIRLVYKDNDILFVSIHSLHRISKYRGKDGAPPKIHKLGSGIWQRQKLKTKSKVKDIAKELIKLYAKRKAEKGFAFTKDSYLQYELESSFLYEDTPDQYKATNDVKKDMESKVPMDRLICGDVGFGKTEVAIRAAFKAVADSKQVAVLVPTTILALQHYNTFRERLADFPCTTEYISRLKNRQSQKEITKKISEGKVDILIGTHRIISKDIQFKDLGLLIIDEEQKFGVSVKEKLKQLKVNVDTLTLTATPIPRTLQFSLMGARDLSIINTPPPNRYPIFTELHPFHEEIIQDAIEYEIKRHGQVFFIHNRVQNIYEVESLINRLCPGVKTIVAHGQMEGPKLEKTMLSFIQGEYDVLVATTIIESGLDIPNVNTIIINNAHHFGLSDLHQLRGRVGRSNKKAFAYLLSPPPRVLTKEARQRLAAIENFSELGSGFNIAMQDLDIRGAGNLLGGEQSGFIADIGLETYQRILDEALFELKEEEFKDLFEDQKDDDNRNDHAYVQDCQIDTDFELLFPEEYIENIAERIRLYRELDNIQDNEQLVKFKTSLVDRFGEIPRQTHELLNIVELRWIAIRLGIEKIILKKDTMICTFISNQESPFYQSKKWQSVILYMQKHPKKCSLKEKGSKLTLYIRKIKDVQSAISTLENIERIENK